MNRTRELLIIDAWKPLDKDVVGTHELQLIQETVLKQYGTSVSPASIARALAEHGVRLGHPEILQADLHWRERNVLFSTEDLTLDSLDDATRLMDKVESLRRQFESEGPELGHLFHEIRQIKGELQLIGTNLARELAQWLTIWLQNPGIFKEWLELRRATDGFRAQFGE
jgi:hypothetical protein